MSLNDKERDLMIKLYLEKSDETFQDARSCIESGRWNAAANRLYYALFHSIVALFVSDGISIGSHKGAKARFGEYYVLSGLACAEDAKLLSQMETLRERADYDAVFKADESIVKERFMLVEQMIKHLKDLIYRDRI